MSEAAVISRPANNARSSMGSVLIIDDEAAIRESLETLLEMEGYAVESADSGEAGLARIGERSFDLVLLDLALPDRNGMELLAEIHIQDAHGVFGPLQIACRPIQAVCNPRKHIPPDPCDDRSGG